MFRQDPLWQEVFSACSNAGDPPTPARARLFLNAVRSQNKSMQDRLFLRGLRLNAGAISTLAAQLKDQPYTRLDFSSNVLGDTAGLPLRKLVMVLPHLRWLSLANCNLHLEAIRELSQELATNSTLEVLELGRVEVTSVPASRPRSAASEASAGRPNVVGDVGLQLLLDGISKNPSSTLTSLSLCGTSLTVEAARQLSRGLSESCPLQHLDLSGNALTSEGVATLIPHCPHLRSLGLADTGCKGELVSAPLLHLLDKAHGLTRLAVGRNPLGPEPLRQLAWALANCKPLASLNLEATCMDAETAGILAEALACPDSSLTELDLSGNDLADIRASEALARLAGHGVLQSLRLNSSMFGDAGVENLARAVDTELSHGGCLQQLELSGCRISAVGAGHLLKSLNRNEMLRSLHLADNFLDDKLDLQLLEGCHCLLELQVHGNRLSQGALQRIAQTIARNRDMAKHGEAYALRSEVHRLLFQEVKVNHHRQQLEEDGAEIFGRRTATEEATKELARVREESAELQRQMTNQIQASREELESRRQELVKTQVELEDTSRRYEGLQQELRGELREREQELAALQKKAAELEKRLNDRRAEHPQQVVSIRERIKAAESNTEQLHDQALHLKQQLRMLQDQSLIDFRP